MSPRTLQVNDIRKNVEPGTKKTVVVPCGRCAFCGASRRSEWATRLHYHGLKYLCKRFITLTYSDKYLTWSNGNPQLHKRDLKLFFKRLRKKGAKFSYYAVGEYGSTTHRPHYHVIMFGETREQDIRDAWSRYSRKTKKYNPLGIVHIGSVTQASIMYCLGYIIAGKSATLLRGRVHSFSVMSQGLGKNYLTKAMVAWHKSGLKNYTILEGQKRKLPRYYASRIFSKLDLVRISVRDQKKQFAERVKWLRSPKIAKRKDPLSYLALQRKLAAQRIRLKCKENLTI